MAIFGYARVSTLGQELEVQLSQLTEAGCTRIYREKRSGATTDRPQLARVLKRIRPGDVLIVTRIDRLARSTLDLLGILRILSEKDASFRSLADPWTTMDSATGRLMLTVFAGFSEYERHLIRARTAEGRALAQERGTRFGRPSKLSLEKQQELVARRRAGESLRELAEAYSINETTVSRIFARAAAKADNTTARLLDTNPVVSDETG